MFFVAKSFNLASSLTNQLRTISFYAYLESPRLFQVSRNGFPFGIFDFLHRLRGRAIQHCKRSRFCNGQRRPC